MPNTEIATFFINSDAVSNGGRSYHEEWIRRGIAVTSGNETYRQQLDVPKRGTTLLMYVNKIGVVAAGTVRNDRARRVERPDTASPNEPFEYHRDVAWHIDIQDQPLSYEEIIRLRHGPPLRTVTSLKKGEEAILSAIAEHAEQLDLKWIENEYRGRPTEALTMVQARLGQGQYRDALLDLWDGRCAVTGCGVGAALRASHAKAWSKANDAERLDPHNGLPLLATLDALFDRGLIGFDDDGTMLCSQMLNEEDRKLLGLSGSLRKSLNEKQREYLREHRERFALDGGS